MADPKIKQALGLGIYQPITAWMYDQILAVPEITGPEDGDKQCPPENAGRTKGDPSGITLEWNAVDGATHYIIQFALNGSFQGPTVKSYKIEETEYELLLSTDVSKGDKLHWRVAAINGQGGTSEMSESRQLSYECEEDQGGDGPSSKGGGAEKAKCKDFNIKMRIDGPKIVMCCDKVTFKGQVAWDCKDQAGNELIRLDGALWEVKQPAVDPGNVILAQNLTSVQLKVNCRLSQLVTVKWTLTFTDLVRGGQFTCTTTHKYFVDCDNKPRDKPWLINYLNYDGVGVVHYLHPDLRSGSLSTTPIVPTVAGPLTVTGYSGLGVMDPKGIQSGTPEQEDGGVPLGYIDIVWSVAVGPTVRTGLELFPERPDETPDAYCAPKRISVGRPTGEIHESQVVLSFGCGLKFDNGNVKVNNAQLAGNIGLRRGLRTYGNCSLQVHYGCGLTIADEKIKIDEDAGTYAISWNSVVKNSLNLTINGNFLTAYLDCQKASVYMDPECKTMFGPVIYGPIMTMSDTVLIPSAS